MYYDIIIIGGGVVGTAIARKLSRYNIDVILLEKENDVAMGTSKANSGIIHAGYNAAAGTLKGKLNVKANPLFDKLCSNLNVPFKRIGSLVIGFDADDLKQLKREKENGEKMGINGLEIIGRECLLKLESNINPDAKYALYAPTAGIVSSYEFTIALADSAVINGVDFLLETEVNSLIKENGRIKGVNTNKGQLSSSVVINAAGLFADDIAKMAGRQDIKIIPRKGEYHLYDKMWGDFVNHVLFPTPSKKSKGILVTPTVHGNLMIGPNSEEIAYKDDLTTSYRGLKKVFLGAKKLVPELKRRDIITSFSGLRASTTDGDFIIGPSESSKGLINVAGIQSPGLSSAPAIADIVLDIVKNLQRELNININFIEKKNFKEKLPPRHVFHNSSYDKWLNIVNRDKRYGEIICRCEKITRGEIIDAVHRPIPAISVDAVKRRTRAGTGRCQGGFCGPRIVEILSEELDIPRVEVNKKGKGSEILISKTKDLLLKKI